MIKTILLPVVLFVFAACSQGPAKANAEAIQPAPVESKQENTCLNIDASLLASENDPVCGMNIKNKVADTATYDHKRYGFCGTGCRDAFFKEPLAYLKSAEPAPKH